MNQEIPISFGSLREMTIGEINIIENSLKTKLKLNMEGNKK